jgi:hypothetical protein
MIERPPWPQGARRYSSGGTRCRGAGTRGDLRAQRPAALSAR